MTVLFSRSSKTTYQKDGKLVLYSLNPLYEPYEVHINEVKEIWKFVNYISSELPEPVLPEKQIFQSIAVMKNDLERIKAKLGKDISDVSEITSLSASFYRGSELTSININLCLSAAQWTCNQF